MASSSYTAGLGAASQADQEASTSNIVAVTPLVQKFHPSAAKAWVSFNGTGTVSIYSSYNVSSITDNGVGNYTVNFSTPFSSASAYTGMATAGNRTTTGNVYTIGPSISNPTASTWQFILTNGGANVDEAYIQAIFLGDQ